MYQRILSCLIPVGVLLSLSGCSYFQSELKTVGDISVAQDSTNVLRVNISFQLESPAEIQIAFWPVKDKQRIAYSSLSAKAVEHSITLVGLRDTTEYEFQLAEVVENGTKNGSVHSFTTRKLKVPMLRAAWLRVATYSFPGLILSQRIIKSQKREREGTMGFVYMTDSVGATVWYNQVPGLPKISTWTKNNTVLVLSGRPEQERSAGDHIYEYDVYGKEVRNLDLNKLKEPLEVHHEVLVSEEDDLLLLTYDRKTFQFKEAGKWNDRLITGDGIVKLNAQGDVVWRWSVFDVMDPTKSSYAIDSVGEWGHANALSVDLDGNYLLSFRDWNQIWKVDKASGKVLWKLGENGDFNLPDSCLFSGQHAIHRNYRGEYMLFDNGVKSRKSRVLSFQVDEQKRVAVVKLNLDLPPAGYSAKRGGAYFINENEILVSSPDAASLFVMNTQGEILHEARTGLPDYYRATFVPRLVSK